MNQEKPKQIVNSLFANYQGRTYKVLAIDFTGVIIRKGEPSVIIEENEGCVPLKDCLCFTVDSKSDITCFDNFYKDSELKEYYKNAKLFEKKDFLSKQ